MKEIEFKLSSDEALVLTDFLIRFQESDKLSIDYESEKIALWNLGSILESKIPEILSPNYFELLKIARDNLISDVD